MKDHPKKWKAPKSNDKKEVEFKGHTWYWCGKETGGKCEKWRAHKPSECKGLSSDAGAKDKRKRDSKGSDKGNSFREEVEGCQGVRRQVGTTVRRTRVIPRRMITKKMTNDGEGGLTRL